jgi:hypothetical protein
MPRTGWKFAAHATPHPTCSAVEHEHSSAETPPNRLSKYKLLNWAEIEICIDSQQAALALQFAAALQLPHHAALLK